MEESRPELEAANIVLNGGFPVSEITPAWCLSQHLLRQEEVLDAKILLFLPELVEWTAGWLKVRATSEQLLVGSVAPHHWQPLPDFAVGVLTLLADRISIKAMGMNREMHFAVPELNRWHRIGDTLVPKAFWTRQIEGWSAGMQSVVVELDPRPRTHQPEGLANHKLVVKVEPSVRAMPGIYVQTNDHRILAGPKAAADTITKEWDAAMARASDLAESILKLGDSA
jgi:hypothetical protein